jgi:RNA polymerase sigma-70 factor (ECF subfamily)
VDDVRLLERMRRGDERAFADLFARHRPAVYRYAVHMCGPDGADDIVQEVFLALLQQLDRYDGSRAPLLSYLLGIARRQALKRMAGPRLDRWPDVDSDAAAVSDTDSDAATAAAGNPFDALSQTEIIERVRLAISRLSPAHREAVVLCELNELDYASAAVVMHCPIGTVRSRLHRARAQLAAQLEDMRTGALVSG